MPIISVKDNKNNRSKRNAKTQKQNNNKKKNKEEGSSSERVRYKWFCCVFKLGLLQLICKASLIFKSNLPLALSIMLKERELYESKHVAVDCKCLKIWYLLSFFDIFLNPSFKMRTGFAYTARTTANPS